MLVKYSDDQLRNALEGATSVAEVLRKLGITYISGSIHTHIKRRLKNLGLAVPCLTRDRAWSKGLASIQRKTASEILGRSDKARRRETHQLRRALLELGVPHECSECECPPVWRGQPLTLNIDHRDGDRQNNTKENLRFLCPNCHSQTSTYGRKSRVQLDGRAQRCQR